MVNICSKNIDNQGLEEAVIEIVEQDFVIEGGDHNLNTLNLSDGTALAPSLHFEADVDTGIYRPASNQIGLSAGGSQALICDFSNVFMSKPLELLAGSIGSPSLTFSGLTNSGFYTDGVDDIIASVNSEQILRINNNSGTGGIYVGENNNLHLAESGAGGVVQSPQTISVNSVGSSVNLQCAGFTELEVSSTNTTINNTLTYSTTPTVGHFLRCNSVSGDAEWAQVSVSEQEIEFADGSALIPSIHFTNDPDSGIFLKGANDIGFSAGGVEKLNIDSTGLNVSGDININPNGRLIAPYYGSSAFPVIAFGAIGPFSGEYNTGLYYQDPQEIHVCIDGNDVAVLDLISGTQLRSSKHIFGNPPLYGELTIDLTFPDAPVISGRGSSNETITLSTFGSLEFFADANNSSAEFIYFREGGARRMQMSATALTPSSTGGLDLGSGALEWDNIYLVNSPIVSSDKRKKKDIEVIQDNCCDLVNKLNPSKWKWIDGDEDVHYGLIAQELEEANIGIGLSKTPILKQVEKADGEGHEMVDTGEVSYGIRYMDFIPFLIKAVQELTAEVENLKKK
jgi:hypothetical protein